MSLHEKQPLLSTTTATSSSPSHHHHHQEEAEEEQEPNLTTLRARATHAQRAYMRAWSRTTSGKWHKLIMLSVTLLLLSTMLFSLAVISDEALSSSAKKKVQLEAHLMSKCPDARDCLHDLILPAMQKIERKVTFRMEFIGTSNSTDLICKHGPSECLGDIIELCAAKLYPDPKIYLGFTMCLSRSFSSIPERELVEDCALEHGIEMEKLNACSSHADAMEMLETSFNRSAEAGVGTSCTVRLQGEVRCVRDDGAWKDCKGGSEVGDLVKDIDRIYDSLFGY